MTPIMIDQPRGTLLGSYFSEIDQTPLLNGDEEKALGRRIHMGDSAARDQMIRANLRLVVKIARFYRVPGVSLDDLIAEGNVGLIRAVEGFDPGRNTRFSTYASSWIKLGIRRFLGSARTLPLPCYVVQMLREWNQHSIGLEEHLNRRPTDEEINARLRLPVRKLRIIKKAIQVLASRRTGAGASESDLGEVLANQTSGPEHLATTKELLGKAVGLLDELDLRESKVLRMRFGMQGLEPMTLTQVGIRLRLTRERVRQIQNEALLKLNRKMNASAEVRSQRSAVRSQRSEVRIQRSDF